jgi:CheY-like chemotaxis protein
MLNIINDLIDISKIEAGQMEVKITETNVKDLLNYFYAFFQPEAEAKNLELSMSCMDLSDGCTISTDKEKFAAIFINLIKNAIKYTNKGSIAFGCSKLNAAQKELEFYVKDTGIGIDKDRQAAVFERFVQADLNIAKPYEGAGLGLAITKAYVEMLGGKIWVESELGVGSIFKFTIPYLTTEMAPKPEYSPESTKVSSKQNLDGYKILIAEDDEFAEMYFNEIFTGTGAEIKTVNSGDLAVEECRLNPEIDIILMDIKMPVMDGYEATREIRKFNKDVVIIAQTAFALAGDYEKAIEAGCNDYLAKPVKKDKLMQMIFDLSTNNQ